MIVNIPLATENKLNCFFINYVPCAVVVFVEFYMLVHYLLEFFFYITETLRCDIN